MAVRYLSPHHSPDDPGGVIKEVLLMGAEFPGPAEDVILSWTIRLDSGRDASQSAARLIEAYGLAEGPLPEGACGRVVELLREAARSPAGAALGTRRRRGGRQRRD